MLSLAAAACCAAAMTVAGWGYCGQVRRAEADPRLVSWLLWTAAMGVAAAAALRTGQWAAAACTGAGAAGCAGVLGFGWRHGSRAMGPLDMAGLAAGLAGLGLLAAALCSRAVPVWAAAAASVGTDLAAFTPAWVNGWRGSEPARPYLWYAVAAAVALARASQVTGILFPAYEVAACTVMVVLVTARRAVRAPWIPAGDPRRWWQDGLY